MVGVREHQPELTSRAADACARLLGITPTEVQAPRRARVGVPDSFRCVFGPRSVIATSRANPRALVLEARALRELGERGVPVPKLLAEAPDWIIVEDVGSRRLSREINQRADLPVENVLDRCLGALSQAHEAGRLAGLDAVFDPLRAGRIEELLQMIPVLASQLGVEHPELDLDGLRATINLQDTTFIKHSALPSHTVLMDEPSPDARVVLIDWQQAGPGDPLEDLVTLLGDESLPDIPDIEGRLIERHLAAFGGAGRREALFALGTLHVARRLVMILSFKGDDDWWDGDEALARDLPLVRAAAVTRLSLRGARWAAASAATRSLAEWFQALGRVAITSRAD